MSGVLQEIAGTGTREGWFSREVFPDYTMYFPL